MTRLSEAIGNTARMFRQGRGLRQADVSRETGKSVSSVSRFENGNNEDFSILWWYVSRGMDLSLLCGIERGEEVWKRSRDFWMEDVNDETIH